MKLTASDLHEGLACFAVCDFTTGDWFEEYFTTEEEALDYADYYWHHMSDHDRKRREDFFVAVGHINSDEVFEIDQEIKRYK